MPITYTNVAVQTTGIAIGFMTDPHIGQTLNGPKAVSIAKWIKNYSPKPKALVVCGDLTVGEHLPQVSGNNLINWLTTGASWDFGITILPVIGNHDTKYAISAPAYPFASGEKPYEYVKSQWPGFFGDKEYYYWDYESVRIMIMCNIVDTTGNDYHNCNPPGYTGSGIPNPSYTGFLTTGSPQWIWMQETSASFKGTWLIGAFHRPMYSAFPSSGVTRPTLRDGRGAILREMILNGMSLLMQGDQHIRFVGKKYINPSGDNTSVNTQIVADITGVGVWPMTLSGGYANRDIDLNELPGQTLGTHYLLASGVNSDGIAAGAVLTIYGDHAKLEVAENKDGIDGNTTVTLSTTIYRNPGV